MAALAPHQDADIGTSALGDLSARPPDGKLSDLERAEEARLRGDVLEYLGIDNR